MRALLLLWLALSSAGCAGLLRGAPGEGPLLVHNESGDAVSVILRIETADGGIPVFSQEVFLERGGSKEFVIAFAPGFYECFVTTTNGLSELYVIEIPARGDARVDLTVFRGRATMTVTQT